MRINLLIVLLLISLSLQAQIGYQLAVLNNATGEPRANESVKVDLTITNSAGGTVFTGSQTAMTNEFGIASLTVGDSETFANVDWNKLPLYISATVDGKLIAKTQILSVPVAEYVKYTGTLSKELLCSKVWKRWSTEYTFYEDGTYKKSDYDYPDIYLEYTLYVET